MTGQGESDRAAPHGRDASRVAEGPGARGGVYVHFPFCLHRCFYCDFNTYTPPTIPHRAYADAVLRELDHRASWLPGPARSLYFGGGTPSLWDPAELGRVVEAVRQRPGLEAGAEITLEANPGEVTAEAVNAWQEAGVNRVSLGVQSLRDKLLRAVDRRHDAATAHQAARLLARGGLESWSLDLIFGLPGQDPATWAEDVTRVVEELAPPHLSVYALGVEAGTPLERLVRTGRVTLPGEDAELDMLLTTRRVLRAHGYEHYEVSSYALPGHRAVHNTGYWELRPYLGLGAGAHGYARGARWMNLRRVGPYVAAALESGDPTDEREEIDPRTGTFERVMTGLRLLEDGVELPPEDFALYEAVIAAQVEAGTLEMPGPRRLRLTERGFRYMNDVLLEFAP